MTRYRITHPNPEYNGNYNGLKFNDGVAIVDGPLPERSMGDDAEQIVDFLRAHGFDNIEASVEETPSIETEGDPVTETPVIDPTKVEEITTEPPAAG